jgi:hypothetical protein
MRCFRSKKDLEGVKDKNQESGVKDDFL